MQEANHPPRRLLTRLRTHWPLAIPVVISTVLSSWALGTVGWGNTYYSAAVRSMSQSWHAFWYGSFDSVGFVSVDKPPFSLWVQALAVRIFGFHSMTLLIPQVLAGVGAVVLVYLTLVRRWGRIAATVGAMALAVTPIAVMVNHSNNTDAILTLMMTATVFAGVRAAETGRWGWVVATGLLFGAAFTSKMLAAAPVLPAVLLAVAVAAPMAWRRRAVLLAGGAAIAVVAGLAWFTFVDLTPASERPYVGSSATNSAFQLAFERNGVNQVEGDTGGRPGSGNAGSLPERPQQGLPGQGQGLPGQGLPGQGLPGQGVPGQQGLPGQPSDQQRTPGGGSNQHGFGGGDAGAFRLFNSELGTQIGWLIVPALAGLAGAAFALRRRVLRDPVVLAATTWLVLGAGAYSITEGIVHPYYVAGIAPPLAMLIGIGAGAVRDRWQHRATLPALGAAVAVSGVVSWVVARRTGWDVATVVALATVAAAIGLARPGRPTRWIALGVLAALATPFAWTVGSLKTGLSANLPYADPVASTTLGRSGAGGNGPGTLQVDGAVVTYLLANRGGTTWLVAAPSAQVAAPIIITTGEPVMALGGFSGGDQILTPDEWDALVENGDVRFAFLGGQTGPGGQAGPGGQGGVTAHIRQTCTAVTDVSPSLYDCA